MKSKLRLILMTFVSFVFAAIIQAAEASPEIFSVAEATRIVGQPVIHSQTIGPEKDDDSPAQATHWTYRTKVAAVIVSRMTFASAAEAKKYATPEFIKNMESDDGVTITPESGVGEKAFWTVSQRACGLIFLKGSTIASISLGGKIDSPESHKADLKEAASAIAARL